MENICKKCGSDFEVADSDLAFLLKVSPKIGEKFLKIPPPTLCYSCRLQKRLSWRNDRNLYANTCSETGKKLVTMYRPGGGINVVDKDYWWSDKWKAIDYGRDFDFSRPFFD